MAEMEELDELFTSIPAIDLSCPDRQVTIAALTEAFETLGFAHLINIPGYGKAEEDAILKATKWFFGLPLEEKLRYAPQRWNKDSKSKYRGYYPVQVGPGREQYFIGKTCPQGVETEDGSYLQEDTPLPDDKFFKDTVLPLYDVMMSLAFDVMQMLCAGLGLDEHTFDDRFQPMSLSTYKLQRYQSFEESKLVRDFSQDSHADVGFLTFLTAFSYPGLEVQKRDGTWVRVSSRPGSLVLNCGDLFARLSNGRFLATQHRVRDLGIKRYSAPFFVEPRSDAKFELPDTKEVVSYGQWFLEAINRYSNDYGEKK